MKKMVEKYFCDCDGKNHDKCGSRADVRCKVCKKDLCVEHSFTIAIKPSAYSQKTRNISFFCLDCIKKMVGEFLED
jgi:hypothetical protein